jgi:hypothetical protein
MEGKKNDPRTNESLPKAQTTRSQPNSTACGGSRRRKRQTQRKKNDSGTPHTNCQPLREKKERYTVS